MTYSETLEYLYSRLPVFHHVGAAAYKPGLDNTIRLMDSLQNPHTKFKSIHIAGTNGKGSVSHMLAAVLQSAGYKVGLYTSPHLVHFGERIRIDGQMIDEAYVIQFVQSNMNLFEQIQPSFFEATMALAFNYFADNMVDIAVIETGLGGRLDSTNIIQPLLSIITNISFDHVGLLGDTLEKIAFEKAGIIKQNIPVVIGESLLETKSIFTDKAFKNNAEIEFAEEKLQVYVQGISNAKMQVLTSDNREFEAELTGHYQLKNLATVLCAIDKLKSIELHIPDNAIKQGIAYTSQLTGLKGRWQIIANQPLTILDTGHNKAGIESVVRQIRSCKYNKLHFILAVVSDKDITGILELLPQEANYYFTQAQIIRALPASELCIQAKSKNLNGQTYNSIKEAIISAYNHADSNDMIFIGGSNFTVGEALAYFENQKKSSETVV